MLDLLAGGAYELFQIICVITLFFYFLIRSGAFNQVIQDTGSRRDYIILILSFGLLSIYGTTSGLFGFGALFNVRDLGPFIGGLVCGPYVGIPAALIGIAYRATLGGVTMVPCCIGTFFAGLFSSLIWYLNKKEYIGINKSILCMFFVEIVHFSLVGILIPDPSVMTDIVMELGPPVIGINMVATGIFGLIFTNYRAEKKTKAELERKNAELKIAHEIQEKFLPKNPPHIQGFDIAALALPARELGGDFFDFIRVSDTLTGVAIADVSGKSVPAALFMALSTTSVRAFATRDTNPDTVMNNANSLIFKYAESGMFVSLWYGVVEEHSSRIWFSNAGHPPPILFRHDGTITELSRTGPIAGFVDEEQYTRSEVFMDDGDILVCFTDGVTEARNSGLLCSVIFMGQPGKSLMHSSLIFILLWVKNPNMMILQY